MLDTATLQALRALDRDGQLLPRLLAAFETSLQQGRAALHTDDPQTAAHALHQLYNGCAQLGAREQAARCRALELQARGGTLDAQALAELDAAWPACLLALRSALGRASA